MPLPSRFALSKTVADNPTILTIKVNETKRVPEKKIRKVVIVSEGCMATTECKSKVILLVGETGSGKTLMINALLNYILGVKWKYNYRYKLDPDEHESEKRTQTQSQTEWISLYTLYSNKSNKIRYSITIIDTPGFGDTAGTSKDKKTTKQMKSLFNGETDEGITQVDAVIFVAQSDKVRLTESQRYVFDSILSLFGEDIKDNIFLFLTFADQNVPLVLEAIKQEGIPYRACYKFNNSPLYAQKESASASKEDNSDDKSASKEESSDDKSASKEDSSDDDETETETETFNKLFWKSGAREFKKFFKELGITPSKSISLSLEVLKEREALNIQLQMIPHLIRSKLVTFKRLSKEQKMLKDSEEEVNRQSGYKYTVTREITEVETLSHGEHAMTCRNCKINCHYPCRRYFKSLCVAFYWFSGCSVCPKNCPKKDHDKVKFIYVKKLISEEQTYDKVKSRYDKACEKKMTHKELVEVVSAKAKMEREELRGQVIELRRILNRLYSIALKKIPTSTAYYLEGLIKKEKERKELEWEDRVVELEEMLREAKVQDDSAKTV